MIERLRRKWIVLSVLSLFALLSVIVVGMNAINYHSVLNEADKTLNLLVRNEGAFPGFDGNKENQPPPDMPPELPYETRYFSVLLDSSGNVIRTETSRISAVDAGTASEYAKEVMQKKHRGFIGEYRFACSNEGENIRITFLDCGRKLDSFKTFLFASMGVAFTGFLIVSVLFGFLSGRILRPIAESYEKQKRFITDAGHELKTPLTIIHANADILEMELGENESLQDIRQQAKRMTELTNDLVLLSRMEETERGLPMIAFPASEIIADVASPFKALAQQQGKKFVCNIQPMLSLYGNDKAIQKLISILMDNALKYSSQGDTISMCFEKQAKNLCLTVQNTTETALSCGDMEHIFDRFYRADLSRNSQTGGHGIGLSIAKAIATAHGGKIQASVQEDHVFQITVFFPTTGAG